MSEQSEAMKERTRQFSYRVGNLVLHMGRTTLLAEVYGKQLLRCAQGDYSCSRVRMVLAVAVTMAQISRASW